MAINLRQVEDLTVSRQAQDLISHHDSVLDYYQAQDKKAETGFNFVRGNQLTPAEREQYRIRGKSPVIFNTLKTPQRAILGTFIATKMDMKWSPQKPVDQSLAVVMESLRIWEAKKNGDMYNDIQTIDQAWAGKGASYQECYMEVIPGKEPAMRTNVLNPFYVHYDPESRQLITRSDAQFVDVDSFATKTQLVETFPEAKKIIMRGEESSQNDVNSYTKTQNVYNDRGAQNDTERNGKYKVVERYYRVRKSYFYVVMKGEDRYQEMQEADVDSFKKDYPNENVNVGFREELWYAVVCEGLSTTEYLHNKKYHTQVKNPYDDHVMWPILEYVAESLNGDPSSFVEHQLDPQRVINSMIGNVANSATHAASTAKLIDGGAFIDETEAQRATKYHSDSNKGFRVKNGRAKDAIVSIDNKKVSPDVDNMLVYSKDFMQDVSAVTPAMQGAREGSETGVLNAQRLEQSQNQLQPMFMNYRLFMEQRNLLRYMYWIEYYTEEMTFKVVDKTLLKGTPMENEEFLTINKRVPQPDFYGNYIPGNVTVENAIDTVLFRITAEESTKSSSYRQKVMMQLNEVLKAPAVQNDPVMMASIFIAFIEMTDVPEEVKDMIRERSSVLQQYDQQKFQQGELAKQQQEIANRQAQQQDQNSQLEAQKNQMDFQADMAKNSIEQQKIQLEARKMQIEVDQAQFKVAELQIKLQESQQNLSGGALDNQLKVKDIELKDKEIELKELEADLKQVEVIGRQEEVAQTRADNTGFTFQDAKEDSRSRRDAAIKQAEPKRAGTSAQTQKEKA